MNIIQTEFEFTLPLGYADQNGVLHKEGTMRLAKAVDEIIIAKDQRVISNPAYLIIILLSRVITSLGTLQDVNPKVIESLFVSDLSYLRALYEKINSDGNSKIYSTCPKCENKIEIDLTTLSTSLSASSTLLARIDSNQME